jgi:8-oxo-dGTP pyrophosphatase MutT (NUDIX family)
LIREVKEETGLDVSIERMLGMHSMFSEPYLQALYACRLTVFQAVQLRADEHVEHRWVTVADMEGMELIPYLASILKGGMLGYVKG